MILAHPVQPETTLEEIDTLRWSMMITANQKLAGETREVRQFTDLVAPDSLELIELKSITLQDGTAALQRVYRWRQISLSIPLVGSYTLFRRGDTIIEFRTDFSEEEWAILASVVQETILRIEVVP